MDTQDHNIPLKFIPLGGCGEYGRNMSLFEYNKKVFIIDCGLMFPEVDMPGVDVIIPDMNYLMNNFPLDRIKAIFLTHGHEDHIGGLPYLLKKMNVPVYGSKLTLGFLKNRLVEHNLLDTTKLIEIKPREILDFDEIKFEFIRTTHSIPDCLAVIIHTPIGKIFYSSDFKIDPSPVDNERFDFFKLAELGEEGLLLLFSDSTNAEREGFTLSEKTLSKILNQSIVDAKGAVIVATFASNVHRIQQVLDVAMNHNKKVCISGRSMEGNIQIAKELGYLNFSSEILISIDKINNYPRNDLILLTTGSQGEPMSALSLMARSHHKNFKIQKDDLVIISASAIPGNEKIISNIINGIYKLGATVRHSQYDDIHVSGHACKGELKLMLALTKPKYFIPVHGEYRQLVQHAKIATEMGLAKENIVVPENGNIIEIRPDDVKISKSFEVKKVLVDGIGVGDVGKRVMNDRKILAEHGIVVVIIYLKEACTEDKLEYSDINIELISRGFIYIKESTDLLEEAKTIIQMSIKLPQPKSSIKFSDIKAKVKASLRTYFFKKTKRRPMIIVRIIET